MHEVVVLAAEQVLAANCDPRGQICGLRYFQVDLMTKALARTRAVGDAQADGLLDQVGDLF